MSPNIDLVPSISFANTEAEWAAMWLKASSRFKWEYLRGLEALENELHDCWERVLPADAHEPAGTHEQFVEPFVRFAGGLYDAFAREYLEQLPEQGAYLDALNYRLKTWVCLRVAPYRAKPIGSLQEAMEADERGEFPGEWQLRMSATWKSFDHPMHGRLQRRIEELFLDALEGNPSTWERFFDRIHKAISRRAIRWLVAHAERWGGQGELGTPQGEIARTRTSVGVPRKRGRPAQIDVATKEAALEVRAGGGTGREIAKVLYKTPYPSTQQVKNAPNVLNHYQKSTRHSPNKS